MFTNVIHMEGICWVEKNQVIYMGGIGERERQEAVERADHKELNLL